MPAISAGPQSLALAPAGCRGRWHSSTFSLRAIRQLVDSLAAPLDEDDFDAARRFLDHRCLYHLSGKTLREPDAIMASYRAGSELARRLFSRVVFGHELVAAVDGKTIRVRYFDELRAGSED